MKNIIYFTDDEIQTLKDGGIVKYDFFTANNRRIPIEFMSEDGYFKHYINKEE